MAEPRANPKRTHLTAVKLSGYKSIHNVEVDLNKSLNIIIGKNATGKTNFLQFLDDILFESYSKLTDFEAELIFQNRDRFRKTLSRKISLKDISFSGELPKVTESFEVIEEVDPNPMVKEGRIVYNVKGIGYTASFIKSGVPDEYAFIKKPFAIEDKGHKNWIISSAEQIRASYFISELKRAFRRVVLEAIIDKKQNSEETWENVIDTFEKSLNFVKPYLAAITPIEDVRLYSDYQIYTSKNEWAIKNLILEFKIDGDWYPFEDLSDGTQRLFYIITEITGIGSTTINRVILIEEPELGIHPNQLHLLMNFIKEQSKEKQIVITTHSPKVLDILEQNELDHIIIAKTLGREKGTQLKKLTQKQIDKAIHFMNEDGLYLSDYWLYAGLED